MVDANESLKALDTPALVNLRRARKDQVEALQAAGRWVVADHYHETWIAPLNAELLRRGVW